MSARFILGVGLYYISSFEMEDSGAGTFIA
jgi:hypothetical protein